MPLSIPPGGSPWISLGAWSSPRGAPPGRAFSRPDCVKNARKAQSLSPLFPCRAEKFPAIRYTPRACPGPGWGKRPIPSYPCGAIYSSLRGVYPSGLRPTGPAYGGAALRADLVALRAISIPCGGSCPLRLRLRAAASGGVIGQLLRKCYPRNIPALRLAPAMLMCRNAAKHMAVGKATAVFSANKERDLVLPLNTKGRRSRPEELDSPTKPSQEILHQVPPAAKRHLPPTAARPRPQAGTPCRPTVRRERGRRTHLSGTSSYPMAPQAAPIIRHTKVGDRGYGLLSGSRCTAPGTKRLPGFPCQRPEPLAASPKAPFGYFPAQSESNPPPGRRNDD